MLPHLMTLQLEANSFTGSINSVNSLPPSSPILEFNVSNNDLTGEIPAWLSRFPASSFAGNKNLCGKPLGRECLNKTVKSEPTQPGEIGPKKRLSDGVVLLIVSIDAAAIVAALVTITYCCYYRRGRMMTKGWAHRGETLKRNVMSRTHLYTGRYYDGGGLRDGEEMVVFEGCKGFGDVNDLLKASAEFLGKGCVGTTYKVVMDSGDVAVVKRVKERKNRREADGWLTMIGGLRHCNIVSLRAYNNSNEELLLVYDFLPNGSLHYLLHGLFLCFFTFELV